MFRRTFAAALPLALFAPPSRAQAQKKLVVYTSNESTLNDLVFGAFTKETGIEVEPVAAGSGVVMRRLQAEKARPLGDIVWGVSRSLLQTNKALFQPYASKNKEATPADYRDPDDLWIGNNLHLLVILQNTKMVPEGQGPKGWADLLDPKWKGKIAFTDPANSGSAYATVTMLVDLWGGGDAGWKKVGELFKNMKVLNRSSLVFQGVGNGEYPLGISLEYAGPMWAAGGAPVKVIYPDRRHDRLDGGRRHRQGRSQSGRGQGLRRLHQPQGRARDDPEGDLPPADAQRRRPHQAAGRHAADVGGEARQVRRGRLDREAHQDARAHQGRDPGVALTVPPNSNRLILRSRAKRGVSISAGSPPRLDGRRHEWGPPFETRSCGALLRVRLLL